MGWRTNARTGATDDGKMSGRGHPSGVKWNFLRWDRSNSGTTNGSTPSAR